MSRRTARQSGLVRRQGRHAGWLAGSSALVVALMLLTDQQAHARPLGSAGQGASAAAAAAAAATLSAQQAAAMAQQSLASLSRATQALQAMQATQNAARAAAQGAGVANGLAPGGLVPDSGLARTGLANSVSTWTGAQTPTQSTSGSQTLVTIKQTQQKAILNWSSFNIGSNTTAYFDQSSGTAADGSNGWVALNRVTDPSGVPSQILGQIRAEGSVYLITATASFLAAPARSTPTRSSPRRWTCSATISRPATTVS